MESKIKTSGLFKIVVYELDHDTKSPTLIKIRHDWFWQKCLCVSPSLGKLEDENNKDNQFWKVEYLPGPNGEKSISPFRLRSLSEDKYLIMDNSGELALTRDQPVDHWSWHHAKFVWNGEKIALVTLGVIGIIGTAIAGGVAAGAGMFYCTGGTMPAIVEAVVAAGCVTPFATGVLTGTSTAVSTGSGGTYTFLCYQTKVPKEFMELLFVSMSEQ